MILTAIAGLILGAGAMHGEPLVCPVMGGALGKDYHKGEFSDYNGVRYWYCCPGCKGTFEKDPAKFAAKASKGKAAGVFLFDPVTGKRLPHDKAIQDYADYNGVRFLFESDETQATFEKDPKKYGTLPTKEALYCSPGKEVVPSYGFSSGFVDHKGVRYYMCCAGCEKPWAKEPEKHAEASKAHVKAPGIATEKPKPPKNDGGG
jgi:YHS domain-containing protein